MSKGKLCTKLFGLLIMQVVLISCGGGDEPIDLSLDQNAIDDELIQTYLTDNSIAATQDASGIYYYPTVENPTGATQQTSGSILSIYFSASVLGGQVIDEVLASQGEEPVKLQQGVNSIVPVGLDVGLAYMREGETFVFIIPSSLAYEDLTFSTLIPTNSIIVIEAELVLIENEQDQRSNEATLIADYIADKELNDVVKNPTDMVQLLASGVHYKRLSAGTSGVYPSSGSVIGITYVASFLDDAVFDRTSGNDIFEYNFQNNVVISGLDFGIAAMESGEHALLIIPSEFGYGSSAAVIPDYLKDEMVERKVIPEYANKVSPFQVLVFDVTLL